MVAEESQVPTDTEAFRKAAAAACRDDGELWYRMFNEKYFSDLDRRGGALREGEDQNAQSRRPPFYRAGWRSLSIFTEG